MEERFGASLTTRFFLAQSRAHVVVGQADVVSMRLEEHGLLNRQERADGITACAMYALQGYKVVSASHKGMIWARTFFKE